MAYRATGTAGNDTLNQSSDTGPGTIAGLAGNDCIFAGSGLVSIADGATAATNDRIRGAGGVVENQRDGYVKYAFRAA